MKEAGLVDSHAYTLVAAKEITLDNLSIEKLVKVRNPYGMKEWTGDWSDNSKKWTVRTRAQVDGENKEDGSFFMSFADFIKFFTTTTICYYQDENVDSFITD